MQSNRLCLTGILAVVLVLSLLLANCGADKITKANFDKIQTGMTEAEVQAILGPPTEAQGVDVAVFSGTVSTWKQKNVTITIQFVNGKVVAKQFSQSDK